MFNMNISIQISLFILLALVVVKIIETIILGIIPNLIHGKTRLHEFHQIKSKQGIRFAIENYIGKRKNEMFLNRLIGHKLSYFSNFFYRWFILIPLSSFFLLFVQHTMVIRISVFIIIFSITVEILNEVIERLWNGIASNVHFYTYVNVAGVDYKQIDFNTSEIIKRISISLILRFSVVCIGFAAAYRSISTIDRLAFKDMNSILDSIYFSLVTITTIGYGDILPLSSTARLIVICQISLSWLLILVMVLHYGTTLTFDLTFSEPNQANSADAKSHAPD